MSEFSLGSSVITPHGMAVIEKFVSERMVKTKFPNGERRLYFVTELKTEAPRIRRKRVLVEAQAMGPAELNDCDDTGML